MSVARAGEPVDHLTSSLLVAAAREHWKCNLELLRNKDGRQTPVKTAPAVLLGAWRFHPLFRRTDDLYAVKVAHGYPRPHTDAKVRVGQKKIAKRGLCTDGQPFAPLKAPPTPATGRKLVGPRGRHPHFCQNTKSKFTSEDGVHGWSLTRGGAI